MILLVKQLTIEKFKLGRIEEVEDNQPTKTTKWDSHCVNLKVVTPTSLGSVDERCRVFF